MYTDVYVHLSVVIYTEFQVDLYVKTKNDW